MGLDGKTPYELRYGKRWRRELVQFGERVMWITPGKHPGGGVSPWKDNGAFFGIVNLGAGSTDYWIGTPGGAVKARQVKRLAPSEQWDVELFFATKGTPWD